MFAWTIFVSDATGPSQKGVKVIQMPFSFHGARDSLWRGKETGVSSPPNCSVCHTDKCNLVRRRGRAETGQTTTLK